jgi:hypothetical protein
LKRPATHLSLFVRFEEAKPDHTNLILFRVTIADIPVVPRPHHVRLSEQPAGRAGSRRGLRRQALPPQIFAHDTR